MANKSLFQSITSVLPRATVVNEAGGPAYKYKPKHALAQMAATGTFDTDATTTYQFSLDYHGKAHPTVAELADTCRDRYRLCFVCDTDIPYDDTWDCSGEVHREDFQTKIESDLVRRKINFIKLSGSLQCRVSRVIENLMSLDS